MSYRLSHAQFDLPVFSKAATFVPNNLSTDNSCKMLNLKHFYEKRNPASIKLGTLFHSIFSFWEVKFTLQNPIKPRPEQSFYRKPVTAPVVTTTCHRQKNRWLSP